MSITRNSWGKWRLDTLARKLVLSEPCFYSVDLHRCCSSAEVLDWIAQVSHKSWATGGVLTGLVHALDDVLHLQEYICSGGVDRRINYDQLKVLMSKAEEEYD